MIVLAICILYVIIGIIVARLATGHIAWTFYENGGSLSNRDVPDGSQWFGASLLGLVVGVLWPACIVLLVRLPAVGAEARGRMRMQQERIQELEEDQRRRERELERELGIG